MAGLTNSTGRLPNKNEYTKMTQKKFTIVKRWKNTEEKRVYSSPCTERKCKWEKKKFEDIRV